MTHHSVSCSSRPYSTYYLCRSSNGRFQGATRITIGLHSLSILSSSILYYKYRCISTITLSYLLPGIRYFKRQLETDAVRPPLQTISAAQPRSSPDSTPTEAPTHGHPGCMVQQKPDRLAHALECSTAESDLDQESARHSRGIAALSTLGSTSGPGSAVTIPPPVTRLLCPSGHSARIALS